MISILKLISPDISPSRLVIHDLPHASDSPFDSTRAPWFPLWRALLGLHPDNRVSFFSGLFSCLFCVSWRMDVYLFFQSLFCWIFVIFLWSLWEFGRLSIFLLIYLSAWVDLLEQWLCLIELIPPIELSPFPFLSLFSVVGHRLLVTSYLDSGADPLYSSVLEHMLRIVPAVLYFPPTLGLLYLMPQSNKWDKWARGAQYTWMVNE